MRKITACLIALSTIIVFNCKNAKSGNSASSNLKRYGLKEGYIQYSIKGDMMSGTQEICFDRYGAREVEIKNMEVKIMGMSQKTKTATYTDFSEGGTIYTVDYSTDPPTGTKTVNPMIKSFEGKDLQEVGKDMLVQMGGRIIGKGKVLGKECDIWEVKNMGTKVWVWNWITLKTEILMGMKMIIEATKILEKCDKKKLVKPNIKYKDMSNVMKSMKGLDALKKRFQKK
ncbi:MAG: hypothetical protein ACE5HS_19275 [bacterium]